jgi:RimJ/RimL family protein N-acetyltransferase
VELHDERLLLRPLRREDAEAVAAACADPDVQRYIPGMPDPYTLEHARTFIASAGRAIREGTRLPLAIVDAASGQLVGAIELRPGEVGSIGYWISPAARRRGYATSALRLFSRWALEQGGVERLELTTHPGNVASQRVAENAGFVREGVLRAYTRFREGRRDSVMFSLLPADLER